jgi:hypothetical protein
VFRCNVGDKNVPVFSVRYTLSVNIRYQNTSKLTWIIFKDSIQIIQPTRCNSFTGLLLDVYVWPNMFRASPRPSSGAYNCTRSFWFYRWSGETPETCWATHKRQIINLWNCCILLVIIIWIVWWCTDLRTSNLKTQSVLRSKHTPSRL